MPKITCKDNVLPKSLWIMAAISQVDFPMSAAVITSGNDGKHMENSLHYKNNALDIRSHSIPTLTLKKDFLKRVMTILGKDYQGILEDPGTPNEHFHIEYDPK